MNWRKNKFIRSSLNKIRAIQLFVYKIQTRGSVKRILSEKVSVKLEIGAGLKKGKDGWTTLDTNFVADLCWDLRKGIPFPDESVSMIYSSHLFEHLQYKEIVGLLEECKRALIPGGKFSISVPDARKYIEAYINNDDKFWNSMPSYYTPAYNNVTKIDYVNYIAYMDGLHKYMFDKENLVAILSKTGFKNVTNRGFDKEIDLAVRMYESIYAECEK